MPERESCLPVIRLNVLSVVAQIFMFAVSSLYRRVDVTAPDPVNVVEVFPIARSVNVTRPVACLLAISRRFDIAVP